VRVHVNARFWLIASLLGVITFIAFSCGEDEAVVPCEDGLVTIAGRVINIDTQLPAPGVRVTLLGTGFRDEFASGTPSGDYELKVPKGSKLVFITDDYDTNEDNWVPLINIDHPNVVANGNMLNWRIHACPRTQCGPDSSTDVQNVAVWDNYLQNGDQNNGDMFVPTSVAEAGGTIMVSIWHCIGGQDSEVPGFSVTSNAPEFPFGYKYAAVHTCADGPDIMHPPSRATTDLWGQAYSWGDPAYTGDTVEITIADMDTLRGLTFDPIELPVRPGTITFIFPAAIEGVANKSLCEAFTCMGYPCW